MSKYQNLIQSPPTLSVKDGAKEVHIYLVSCMCDNKYEFTMRKGENGWSLSTGRFAYSNFGIPVSEFELELLADEGNWSSVFQHINSGFQQVEKVLSR
jgi:hypothetical protein